MLGVTRLANNYVRIGIKHRIIKNRLCLYRTGIDLSKVADSGQFIDPLSVCIVPIIASITITQDYCIISFHLSAVINYYT